MKNLARFAFLFLISIILSGCKTQTISSFSLQGNCELAQTNHFVKLGTDAAHGFDATSFTLTFVGKEKPVSVDSIHGSYEYKSKPAQPLELKSLTQSNAVFVPSVELFTTKSPQNIVQYVRMNYGHYKLNFNYVVNGQSNSCNFDVNYVCKTKTRFLFFWEWFEYLNYGPGP